MINANDPALLDYRAHNYRQRPDLRVWNREELADFVDDVGFCLFQPNRGVELPSLWGAISGSNQPAPRWGQHDSDYERAWTWKDQLLSSGRFFYGKALGNYRLFVSRAMLPHLWALSEMNYGGEEGDFLELYQDGKLSLDAKNIYEVLQELGPCSTTILRRRTGMVGDDKAWARFERALTELQRGLLIGVVGIADDNAWKYTFKYATLIHAYPAEVAAARDITSRVAMAHVLARYVGLVGSCSVRVASRLFGWEENRCLRAARALLENGAVSGAAETGQSALVAPALLPTLASSA